MRSALLPRSEMIISPEEVKAKPKGSLKRELSLYPSRDPAILLPLPPPPALLAVEPEREVRVAKVGKSTSSEKERRGVHTRNAEIERVGLRGGSCCNSILQSATIAATRGIQKLETDLYYICFPSKVKAGDRKERRGKRGGVEMKEKGDDK